MHVTRHTTHTALALTVYPMDTGFAWSVSTRAQMLAVGNHPWHLVELAAGTMNAHRPRFDRHVQDAGIAQRHGKALGTK